MARKAIHQGSTVKFVEEVDLPQYIAQGWEKGRGRPSWNKGLTAQIDERVRIGHNKSLQNRLSWSEERCAA